MSEQLKRQLIGAIVQYAVVELRGTVMDVLPNTKGFAITRVNVSASMGGKRFNYSVSLFDEAAANRHGLKPGDNVEVIGQLTFGQDANGTWLTSVDVHDDQYVTVLHRISEQGSAAFAGAVQRGRDNRQAQQQQAAPQQPASQQPASQQPASQQPASQQPASQQPASQQTPAAQGNLAFSDDIPF